MGNTIQKVFSSDPYPETFGISQYDAHFGFTGKRQERPPVKITKEDMIAAKIPPNLRDYCVDYYVDLMHCHKRTFPYVQRCITELHKYHKCEYDDMVLRMKEYERERRLLIREEDKQTMLKAAA